jgi:hypothetical protein
MDGPAPDGDGGAKASVEELLAIADRAAGCVKGPNQPHGAVLYGDDGLLPVGVQKARLSKRL